MGAIIEKIPRQSQTSFISLLQSRTKRPKSTVLVAVKFPRQHLEAILADIKKKPIKGVSIVSSTLSYRRARYQARLRKQPFQNILAVMPTAWKGWDSVDNDLYTHKGGKVYLLDNSMEAYDSADKEMVLNEKGEIVAERDGGCFC